ncbi:unnamed protein product, partial [Staurois parvus]
MSGQYRYPPNDHFLQSRQSNVFQSRHGKFFEFVLFCHIFFGKKNIFFFYILSP